MNCWPDCATETHMRYRDLMTAAENILSDGHMNTEHLAALRQAWEAAPMKHYDAEGVRALLLERLSGRTHAALAADLGVTQSYLSKVLAGDCNPGEKLLTEIGLRRFTCYIRKEDHDLATD